MCVSRRADCESKALILRWTTVFSSLYLQECTLLQNSSEIAPWDPMLKTGMRQLQDFERQGS